MDEAGLELVDLHAVRDEVGIVGLGGLVDEDLVRNAGGDDPHVDAAPGRVDQGLLQALVDDEIGRGDPHIALCALDEAEIDVFPDGLAVERAVGVGLDIAASVDAVERAGQRHVIGVIADLVGLRAAEVVPHGEEHDGEAPRGLPAHHDGGILPVAAPLLGVDVFVRQVDAAGEGGDTVDHADLAVVAVVLPGEEEGDEPLEDAAVDPLPAELSVEIARDGERAADIVVDDADVDARFDFFEEDLMHGVPHLALADDEVLEENVALGPAEFFEQDGEHGLAALEIAGLAVLHGRAVGRGLDVARLTGGRRILRLEIRERADFPRRARSRRLSHEAHLAQRASRGAFPAEDEVERDAEDGERKGDDDPAELVRHAPAVFHEIEDENKIEERRRG